MVESTQKSIRMADKDIEALEELVRAGHYKNFNDAVNFAVRRLIEMHRALERSKVVEHPHGGDEKKAVSEVRQ